MEFAWDVYLYQVFGIECLRVGVWRRCVVRTSRSFMLRVGHGFCISLESRIRSPEVTILMASKGIAKTLNNPVVHDLDEFARVYQDVLIIPFEGMLGILAASTRTALRQIARGST